MSKLWLLVLGISSGLQAASHETVPTYAVLEFLEAHGNNAMSQAACHTDGDMMHALLQKTIDQPDEHGATALISASSKGILDNVRALLPYAHINHRDSKGATALMYAAQKGHLSIVQLLLAAQADSTLTDNSSQTPLMLAATHDLCAPLAPTEAQQKDYTAIASLLLKTDNTIINKEDDNQWTALMKATYAGYPSMVQLLLRWKADITKGCETPLLVATKHNHAAVALLLLKQKTIKAVINNQNYYGTTALMFAAKNNKKKVVQHLLRLKADTTLQDLAGETVYNYAHPDVLPLIQAHDKKHKVSRKALV